MSDDRIVITGAGLNCCLGLDRHTVWQAVRAGRCGIGPLTALEQPDEQRDGGQCPPLDDTELPDQPREVRYLRRAIDQALAEAHLQGESWPDPRRVGLVLGTTLAGMRAAGTFLRTDDPATLHTFLAGATMQRAGRGLAISGFSATTCAACASGLSAVAVGLTLLRQGELDVVIAGGYDTISEYVYGGFNSLRLITHGPPLPFSRHRQGMKLGEGTGIVVLERFDHAQRRGVTPLACVLGFGESSDAHHLTKPQPEGLGAAAAITAALADAKRSPDDIDMIAAHATATPNNDAAEFAAYQRVFGERLAAADGLRVTAFKSHVGHTLGAAGAVELILSLMSMNAGEVPPLANVRAEDIEFDALNVVTGTARSAHIRHSINLSLGFGGANSCIVLGQCDEASHPVQSTPVRSTLNPGPVCITGVGVVLPGCVGNETFIARMSAASPGSVVTGSVDEQDLLPLFANARRVRRFSGFVKLLLAATNVAVRHAGLDNPSGVDMLERASAFLGSTLGTVDFTEQYYRQVVAEGIDAANPMLFAEGVPNVASAQLSLLLNLRGCSQTIIGTRTAGLDALHIAAQRIACGACERVIVGAAEEHNELMDRLYAACGLSQGDHSQGEAKPFGDGSGFRAGAGAVVLVLESHDAAQRREAPVYGIVERTAHAQVDAGGKSGPADMIRAVRQTLDAIGRPGQIVSSANNTWLDRVERAAVERDEGCCVEAMYGRVPEMFSVTPLAALAWLALLRGMPGSGCAADDRSYGVLATDYNGSVAAARLRID